MQSDIMFAALVRTGGSLIYITDKSVIKIILSVGQSAQGRRIRDTSASSSIPCVQSRVLLSHANDPIRLFMC